MKLSALSLVAAACAIALSSVAVPAHATTAAAAARTGVACRLLPNPMQMTSRMCLCQPCHMCEFSFIKGSCGLIKSKDQSLSDGSDVAVEPPLLKPEQWFLSADAITKSRGGVARDGLVASSAGNAVQAFVATKEVFDAVFDDLEATRAGDRVLLSAWSTDNVPFKPETDPSGAVSSFQSVVRRAVARGVSFHALVWNNVLEQQQNVRMRNFVHALPRNASSGRAEFIFDDRLPAAASAHHQKTLVVQRASGAVVAAYVGGVDLTGDRWDTIAHDQDALRKRAGIDRGSNGWLDAHVRIVGPAANDVAANFVARWNSKTRPSTDALDDALDFENPAYAPLAVLPVTTATAMTKTTATLVAETDGVATDETSLELDSDSDSDSNDLISDSDDSDDDQSDDTDSTASARVLTASADASASHSVQIVRTFSCKYAKYEFAPRGESSLLQARIEAIRNAKNYIYIEDQYFVLVPQLLDELLKVLPGLQRLIVVAPRPETAVKVAGYEKYMFDMVAPLQKRFPNKFQFYATKATRNLYIHSKLVVIDDVYVSIGSGNWNRRSMTSDSEIGANIVDTAAAVNGDGVTVNKLALDYRLRKFVEHTGATYDELKKMPFLEAANRFDVAAKDPRTIIEVLEVEEKPYFAAYTSDSVRNLVDPQDVCK